MGLSPITIVWLAVSSEASEVTLTRAQFDALQPEAPPRPEPSPGALVVSREVHLDPVGTERVDLRASWRVVVTRPSSVSYALAGPGVEVQRIEIDGRSVSVTRDTAGNTILSTLLTRSAKIAIVGTVRGDPGSGAEIVLLEAGSGTVDLPPSFVAEGAVWLAPGRAVGAPARLRLAPAPARSEQGTLVLGETALGLTVGEAELRVRGRVRWRIARGSLDRVGFSLPGAGVDLVVTGPQVSSWTRTGDHVDVVLREPARSLVTLEVSYTTPVPGGETGTVVVPDLRADGVFRTTSSVQIARDGQVDLIPALPGWQPTAPSSLPEWGRSLVEGVPTAAYVGQGGAGTVSLYRFTPADSPATIIDVAGFTLATTVEGRVLMRAHYAVRNDRGALLRVTPPPGLVPIGVRVGGESADIARDGDVWLVPLQKSVETVEGLLSFPVEVNFLGEVGVWGRRERRDLVLPAVDAEVAVSRVTMYLPPGFRSQVRPGVGDAVEAFTEGQGITYGFAVGDARAAQADALFQQAVDAWMDNAFDETTEILDQLEGMGASNTDIGRLRSNLDVIESKDTAGGEVALERRVLEQARARSNDDTLAQEEKLEIANQAYASGDYKAAEENYRQALDLGEDLAKLQTSEDRSQEEVNVALRNKLEAVQKIGKEKADNFASQSAVSGKEKEKSVFGGNGTVRGVVTDETDIELPGAEVVLSGSEDGERRIPTPVDGSFVFDGLSPGAYELSVTFEGVLVARSEVTVEPDTAASLQIRADTRAFAEEIEVDASRVVGKPAAETVASDTESTSVGQVLTREHLQKIPVGRTYQSVVESAPGVAAGGRGGDGDMGARASNENESVVDEPNSSPRGSKRAEPPSPMKDGKRDATGLDNAPPDPMAVTAATLSVVIPTIGEVVHYQRLLLPAGTVWEVPVAAREHRRNR